MSSLVLPSLIGLILDKSPSGFMCGIISESSCKNDAASPKTFCDCKQRSSSPALKSSVTNRIVSSDLLDLVSECAISCVSGIKKSSSSSSNAHTLVRNSLVEFKFDLLSLLCVDGIRKLPSFCFVSFVSGLMILTASFCDVISFSICLSIFFFFVV